MIYYISKKGQNGYVVLAEELKIDGNELVHLESGMPFDRLLFWKEMYRRPAPRRPGQLPLDHGPFIISDDPKILKCFTPPITDWAVFVAPTKEIVAAIIGSHTSEKKKRSSADNGKKGGRPPLKDKAKK